MKSSSPSSLNKLFEDSTTKQHNSSLGLGQLFGHFERKYEPIFETAMLRFRFSTLYRRQQYRHKAMVLAFRALKHEELEVLKKEISSSSCQADDDARQQLLPPAERDKPKDSDKPKDDVDEQQKREEDDDEVEASKNDASYCDDDAVHLVQTAVGEQEENEKKRNVKAQNEKAASRSRTHGNNGSTGEVGSSSAAFDLFVKLHGKRFPTEAFPGPTKEEQEIQRAEALAAGFAMVATKELDNIQQMTTQAEAKRLAQNARVHSRQYGADIENTHQTALNVYIHQYGPSEFPLSAFAGSTLEERRRRQSKAILAAFRELSHEAIQELIIT